MEYVFQGIQVVVFVMLEEYENLMFSQFQPDRVPKASHTLHFVKAADIT